MPYQMMLDVFSWIDGDTCRASLDLGVHVFYGSRDHPVRLRMAHINSPEMSTPQGQPAKAAAEQLVPPGRYACISTGLDNYGRPLVDIPLPDGRLFSAAMLAGGFAVPLN